MRYLYRILYFLIHIYLLGLASDECPSRLMIDDYSINAILD